MLVVSLLLAILINKKAGRLTKGYRVALFLPSITSTVAVSMVWLWIFNPDMGILNNILTAIGLNDVPLWLGDPAWSKPALVIMRVWQMSGYYMLMFLAGLQTIPETLYEAADVDGATGWQKFIRITVPMLSNTTFVVAILLVIEAFNMFESIFVMTQGGPLGSTSTIMYYIYEQGFTNYNMGYASALAWIFFAIIMVVTLIQYRFRHEQGGE
ncbi:MAG: carbohydrate ABC transporter permease [Ruthenibacterium lactatiformans]|uniref:carbohydrate ABC transporter permease n=1 Tax=Ruthenibacterium lactatiformans TaxID=1550024 RepID=UPI0039910825